MRESKQIIKLVKVGDFNFRKTAIFRTFVAVKFGDTGIVTDVELLYRDGKVNFKIIDSKYIHVLRKNNMKLDKEALITEYLDFVKLKEKENEYNDSWIHNFKKDFDVLESKNIKCNVKTLDEYLKDNGKFYVELKYKTEKIKVYKTQLGVYNFEYFENDIKKKKSAKEMLKLLEIFMEIVNKKPVIEKVETNVEENKEVTYNLNLLRERLQSEIKYDRRNQANKNVLDPYIIVKGDRKINFNFYAESNTYTLGSIPNLNEDQIKKIINVL